jgi:transketolase
MSVLYDCRDRFAHTLEDLGRANENLLALCCDTVGSSKLAAFARSFPERLINVGIAEQNVIGIASGLANGGMLPFVCAASCFLTGRALEQIKVDVAYSRANVKLCGMSSGMAYGELGPTHHSIEDLAWMRAIAGMTIIVPADPIETELATRAAAAFEGPVFIRVSRMPVPAVHREDYPFKIGCAALLQEGSDITIIAAGVLVSRALEAAKQLVHQGISARVLNMATVQPLDREAIVKAAQETGAIVTVDEHSIAGGLGSAVAEVVVSTRPVPMRILGVPGVFAPTGSAEWLLEYFGLTAAGIQNAAIELLQQRGRI